MRRCTSRPLDGGLGGQAVDFAIKNIAACAYPSSARGTFCAISAAKHLRCATLGIVVAQRRACPQKGGGGAFCPRSGDTRSRGSCTRLAALQVRATAGEKAVVHSPARSLLLPLCIYKNLRRKTRGKTAGEGAAPWKRGAWAGTRRKKARGPKDAGLGRQAHRPFPQDGGCTGAGGRYWAGAAGAGAPAAAGPRGPWGPAPGRPWWPWGPGPSPRMPPMCGWSRRVWVSNTFCCSGVRAA